jgi:hypothetical protein
VHTRVLLRARKGPFDAASAEDTLERNLVGTNSGNLVFLHAAYKLLRTREAQVSTYGGRPDPVDAGWINERHDIFVIPLANAFRASFEPHLLALTELIRRLRIPVVVLGVGAQSNLDYETARLRSLERSVKAFVSAVLDRSPSIGVRGRFSHAYLKSLGFHDVEVIGCPSMFLYGPQLEVREKSGSLEPSARLAINLSPGVPGLGKLLESHLERYPNLIYIAQDLDTLALMLLGQTPLGGRDEDFPLKLGHPLFAQDRARFFLDPWPWLDYLRGFDFAFGTRIHGNVAALVAGTPAYVLAHDSRTLELAEYFDIPHRRIDRLDSAPDAAELYVEADFGPLLKGHAARWAAFAAFLERHGLKHVFSDGESADWFEQRVAATDYPPAVRATDAAARPPAPLQRRLRYALKRASRSDWARRLRASRGRPSASRIE